MAFTIIARVGEDNPKAVVATTILSYSLSSVLTGAVFFLMGRFKLGSLVGFFPRHILIGCIGGVGWFLVATGLEVSARLDGSLDYNLKTLEKLLERDTIFLWLIPLILSINLFLVKHWIKKAEVDALYFVSIIGIFYFFVAVIPNLKLPELRSKGWVFEAPDANIPFYHFYSLYGRLEMLALTTKLTSARLWCCRLDRNHGDDPCHALTHFLRSFACTHQHPCPRHGDWRRRRRHRPRT